MKKPELLAPAGNFESLIAAIEGGCDAVYLSGTLYGARNFAGNFSDQELIDAIKYCHSYCVKVYVTVNTLIYDAEVDNFIKYIDFLYKNNVDAIIIQDIGMFDLIRKKFPNLEIHISTQMHIHNLEGVQFVSEYGASRVVLARETPIELIRNIKNKTNIELEIFVHGALCISYSGQCLMSSLIGGRSGNRGTCAQCCRQPYEIYCNDVKISDEKYLLSTKDLNTLDKIGELIELGIDSFKIEGRMKRPEYVFLVVSLYRKAIDSYLKYKKIEISENDINDLKKIFNRKFTNGFLFNSLNNDIVNKFRPNHLGVEIGKVYSVKGNNVFIKLIDELHVNDGIRFLSNDYGMTIQNIYLNKNKVKQASKNDLICIKCSELPAVNSSVVKTSDYLQLKNIQENITKRMRKIDVSMDIQIKLNNKIILTVEDMFNNVVTETSEYIVSRSINKPTLKDNVYQQLSKLGDTNFNLKEYNILLDEDVFVPVKILNDLRRNCLNKLKEKYMKVNKYIVSDYSIEVPNFQRVERKVLLITDEEKKFNSDLYDEIETEHENDKQNNKFIKKLPRVQEYIAEVSGNLLLGDLGSIYKYIKENRNIVSDFSLNITNSYSVAFLHSIGVNRVTLSVEMNDYQIKRLIENYIKRYDKHPNLELIVKGPIESMILKYDLFDKKYDKTKKYYLKDKYGNKFRCLRKNNLTYIYHYEDRNINNYNVYYQYGVNYLREIL